MAEPWDGVLVRFGEIGIKSAPVRRTMVQRLRQNLLDQMLAENVQGDVAITGSRLWMAGPDSLALADLATRVFGIVSVSLARRCGSAMETMQAVGAEVALRNQWTSFAVRASREGTHPYTSQDIAVKVGSAVWTAAKAAGRPVKVDLTKPEQEVHVEVRGGEAYVYTDKLPGPGGLPLGSQGKVVALISDPASAVAAWFAMRRGCRVVPIHAGDTGSVPVDALATLKRWGLREDAILLPACTGSVTKQVLVDTAARLSWRLKAIAIVTGDRLDSRLVAPKEVALLRPVCGLPDSDLADFAKRIGINLGDVPDSIVRDDARETVESLLSMRRRVTA